MSNAAQRGLSVPRTSTSYPPGHERSSELPLFPSETIDPPWDGPDWDDPDRWFLGPEIPPGVALMPPELEDDEDLAAFVHPAAVHRAEAANRIARRRIGGTR